MGEALRPLEGGDRPEVHQAAVVTTVDTNARATGDYSSSFALVVPLFLALTEKLLHAIELCSPWQNVYVSSKP